MEVASQGRKLENKNCSDLTKNMMEVASQGRKLENKKCSDLPRT